MTKSTKAILIIAATGIAGTAFWLWWRQKDAVPASAVQVMQQAKAVLVGSQPPGSQVLSAQPIFPGDIPLPVISIL